MLKPFFVGLSVGAVVMARDEIDARAVAKRHASAVCSDCDMDAGEATPLVSLAQLTALDSSWDGMCLPYGGDGNTRLNELLPGEDAPSRCPLTRDMFAPGDSAPAIIGSAFIGSPT